jgi:hypothetical protein
MNFLQPLKKLPGPVLAHHILGGISTLMHVGHGNYVGVVGDSMDLLEEVYHKLHPGTPFERCKTRRLGMVPLDRTYPVAPETEPAGPALAYGHDYPLASWFHEEGREHLAPQIPEDPMGEELRTDLRRGPLARWFRLLGRYELKAGGVRD